MRTRMDLRVTEGFLEIICDKKFSHKFELSTKGEINSKNDIVSKIIVADLQKIGMLDYLNKRVILESNTFHKLILNNTKIVYFFLSYGNFAEAFVIKNIHSIKSEVVLMTPDGVKRATGLKNEDSEIRVYGQGEAFRYARESIY
jgi:hypothetical protein